MVEPAQHDLQEFYEIVDQFIALANTLGRTWHTARVSAAIMYAAARYNAFNICVLDSEPEKNRERAFDYLSKQYQAMLRENMAANLGRTSPEPHGPEPESP